MGAKHGRGNDKGPKKFMNRCFWEIINDPLVYITSNKELCSQAQV